MLWSGLLATPVNNLVMKVIKWLLEFVGANLVVAYFLVGMSITGYFLENTKNGLLAGVLVICVCQVIRFLTNMKA